ncbi:4a-hydroxytetrahydrobiopterin dehydratase [soil metagenome]
MRLSDDAIAQTLDGLHEWRRESDEIVMERSFPTYKDGLVFANAVGWIADGMDHHPDLLVGYRKVGIRVSTHSEGGVTEKDFELARRIAAL